MLKQTFSRKKRALLLLGFVQFISLADASIVQVAIPSIQQSLNLSPHLTYWILTGYAVMCGGFMLLGGRMGDLWGRRRMLAAGTALFALASIGAAAAGNGALLVLARGFQGIGAALMIPSVLALITMMFPEGQERNRALGLLGMISAAGFTSGLIAGGFLTDLLGWRSIFFVHVPMGAALLFLIPRLLPESAKVRQPLDIPGAIAGTGSLLALLLALTTGDLYGWKSSLPFGLTGLSVLLFIIFLFIEKNAQYPMVPLHLFSQRTFAGAVVASVIFGAIMGASLYMANLYMQYILGYRPAVAALAFLPQELTTMICAWWIGKWAAKLGLHSVLSAGMIAFGLGLWCLSGIQPENGYLLSLLPGFLLIGLGAALVLVSGSIAAMTNIRTADQGIASGLWNTGPHIGTSFGIAALTVMAGTRARALQEQQGALFMEDAAWVSGFQTAFAAGIVFAGIGLCAAWLFKTKRKAKLAPSGSRCRPPANFHRGL